MKVFHLLEHSYTCKCKIPYEERLPLREKKEDEDFWSYQLQVAGYLNSHSCEKNPNYFLFQLEGDFYLIVYYECITLGDKTGYFKDLLKKSIEDSRGKKFANIRKSINYEELLKRMKKGEFQFKNYHEEIMHIYKGSFGVSEYCITRKVDYFQKVFSQDIFKQNYLKAIEELKKLDLYHVFKDEIYRLYNENLISGNYYNLEKLEIEVTDILIKQINKIGNGNS